MRIAKRTSGREKRQRAEQQRWWDAHAAARRSRTVEHKHGSEEVPTAEKCDIHPDAFGEGGCYDKREPGTRFCKVHLAQVLKAGLAGK